MSEKREKMRRLQARVRKYLREIYVFEEWLAEEPPVLRWRKWHEWKKKRPEIRK